MTRRSFTLLLSLIAWAVLPTCHRANPDAESQLRSAFRRITGRVQLPAGTVELHAPLEIASGAHDLEIDGAASGSILCIAKDFKGKAAILGNGISNITLAGFRIEGNRASLTTDRYLPPYNVAFADYYENNGIVLRGSRGVAMHHLAFRNIQAFPLLVNNCSQVRIENIDIENSGTLNLQGRSNTSGGILLEEGTVHFLVRHCRVKDICGNAIWTHSNYGSPRNSDGTISENEIYRTPRDAIQVGHALRVRVLNNRGGQIGVPAAQADTPVSATPVAIDTSGNVGDSLYSGNHFEDVDGQCIDLDGFHDGRVIDNSCVNRKPLEAYPLLHAGILFGNSNPDMETARVTVSGNLIEGFAYGGLYLLGTGQQIIQNRFIDVNRAHCTGDMSLPRCGYYAAEPGMLRSGIYLAAHGSRPALTRSNTIRGNYISGFGMDKWCIAAGPGVDIRLNSIESNTCVATR